MFPRGGLSCKVTVADNGTVTSTGGMVTAMNSDSATERLEAIKNLTTAQMNLMTAQMNLTRVEGERDTAQMNLTTAQTNLTRVEGERDTAQMNLMTAQTNLTRVEGERDTAQMELTTAQKALTAKMIEFARIVGVITNVKLDDLATNFKEIDASRAHVIPPDDHLDVDDVTFNCPAGVIPCVVVVIADDAGNATTVVSLGGAASVGNTVEVMDLRAANALTGRGGASELNDGALATPVTTHEVVVTSDTNGDTTIMLTMVPGTGDFDPEEVDANHIIDGWPGQTLKRGGTEDLMTPQEATVYTDIEAATEQKLKRGGEGEVALGNPDVSMAHVYVLLGNVEEIDDINDNESTFRATYNGESGTFTCPDDNDNCNAIEATFKATTTTDGVSETSTIMCGGNEPDCSDIVVEEIVGQVFITSDFTPLGWTFVSDLNVESEAKQDEDYLYFGYWMQFPSDPGADYSVLNAEYMFATYSGGANPFNVRTPLIDAEGVTANYVGGAAGRYATTKTTLDEINQSILDPNSPRKHGRFTATARLEANFGMHNDEDVADNTITGKITDFKDLDLEGEDAELRFGVVKLLGITFPADGAGIAEDEMGLLTGGLTSTIFESTDINSGDGGTGAWSGQFFGPNANADDDEMDSDVLPTGVAGKFNVHSMNNETYIVGAFAASKEE